MFSNTVSMHMIYVYIFQNKPSWKCCMLYLSEDESLTEISMDVFLSDPIQYRPASNGYPGPGGEDTCK